MPAWTPSRQENPLGDGRLIDHVDGNTLDCRKGNLRICTYSQNGANRKGLQKQQTSKYKGVMYIKARGYYKAGWAAVIRCNGEKHYLGFFRDEYVAVKAYNVAAYRCFGGFAYLNRWDGPTSNKQVLR